MVIVKYIGKTIDHIGKPLWDIVGNLKNFGVGRVVVRNVFERYPEKSFMKILSVAVTPKGGEFDYRKVEVIVEKTFRGKTYPEPENLFTVSYKSDYRLLSKDEEAEYCKITQVHPDKILPSQIEMPPLMRKYLAREYAKKGMKLDENMTLKIPPARRESKFNTWADPEVNKEVFKVGFEINKTKAPSLFAGVNFPDK